MADRLLQNGGAGAVVDGQTDLDFGNLHIGDDRSFIADQLVFILLFFRAGQIPAVGKCAQIFVKGICSGDQLFTFVFAESVHIFRVGNNHFRLVKAVPTIAHSRIKQ